MYQFVYQASGNLYLPSTARLQSGMVLETLGITTGVELI